MEKLFDECEDEFCESFGVYDGNSKPLTLNFDVRIMFEYFLAFSQQMIFFPSMMMRKTLGIGQIVSDGNTLIKSMQKLRDWQHRLLDGKDRRANKRETE